MSHRNAAFTLNDLSVLIVCTAAVFALLAGIVVPAFYGRRTGHPHAHSSTQIRGIHTGLVLFAQGNHGHYPGVMADGRTIDPAVGLDPHRRIQKLIDDNYFTLEYARSPTEIQTRTTSYALLKVDYDADGTIAETLRNKEWRDTANAEAPVISDRAVVSPSKAGYTSIRGNGWKVAWNDNHVTLETTSHLVTKYNATTHADDDLFTTAATNAGDDAFMVWSDTDSL